ncbi:Aspartokinase 2, chloroplastic [Seminavis robusta]|uniref:Aspartokinase n=1 Tax=Seminavis robusta TaxID=568900 RepID=A0A9N8DZ56_9STRA|nr:Aspartokinase 2, chloroplastic [Seminavis robusta]|eukprot:Sro490_g153500.1 Aspartokinase 2, chloroplastic (529) ;mRNA; r:30158-32041
MRHFVSATSTLFLSFIGTSDAFLFGPTRNPRSHTHLYQTHHEVEDYREGIHGSRNTKDEGVTEVVMKFGGSSLADATRVDHVANLIKDQIQEGYRPRAVVCSAMGKTTNALLAAGDFALDGKVCLDATRELHMQTMDEFKISDSTREEVNALLKECENMLTGVSLIQELSPKSLDQLVSYGERCSVRIMAERLNQIGVPAKAFDAWDVGIVTDSDFGDAKLLPESSGLVRRAFESLDPNVVAVVTGFIGHSPEAKITTLGRGGSDLTATQIGAAMDLDEIQCWKDVDGILSTDPRLVKAAVPVKHVTFQEASELSYFGASVLHPIAMQPAMQSNVPVRVKNSYNPSAEGTIISNAKTATNLVTALTFKRDVKVLDIYSTKMLGAYGFLARVFGDFEKHKLSVDVLASSEVSVSLTLDKKQKMDSIRELVKDMSPYADVTLTERRSILTLIADVKRSSEVLATVFQVFAELGISVKMMSQGASKVNISFILRDDQLDTAVQELHKCFFEGNCIVNTVSPYVEMMKEETV